jgi:NAD(P)H-flavin reductase
MTLLDYLHITKRFGHIAASQFPIHYMLSMRSIGSPLAFIFRSSHEQLNPWHQLSGRIIYFLLLNHAGWYINFFIQTGIFYQRLTAPVVIIGLTGFCLITVVATTSLEIVRRRSYRVFYTFHLTIGLWLLPLLFFHARPLRLYVSEAIALFLVNKVIQNLDTIQSLAIIAPVPHTSLVTIKVSIPASKLPRFEAAPGQHVYLFIPPESRANKSSQAIHDFLFNPFTVVDISPTNITLVLRTLHGPTTKTLETLATLPQPKSIKLEGPYGSSRFFPNFAEKYDRILLVAGGIGATFILPIYRAIHQQLETESKNSNQLTFHWSIRSAEEASWAINDLKKATVLKNDENVKIYITGSKTDDQLDNIEWAEQQIKANESRERPDLREIVDEIFRAGKGEKVAVLVCGPEGMARELRAHVGRWVHRGREVWWHDERFGW